MGEGRGVFRCSSPTYKQVHGAEALNRKEGKVFFAIIALKSNLCFEGLGILNSICIYDTRIVKTYMSLFIQTKSGNKCAGCLALDLNTPNSTSEK